MKMLCALALVLPGLAAADVVFQEDFETGATPYGFDRDLADGQPVESKFALAEGRGKVWLNRFSASDAAHPFGHAVALREDWALQDAIHWGGYIKFGYRDDSPEWRGDGYALAFPAIGDGLRVEFRPVDMAGKRGHIVLVTPGGGEHVVGPAEELQSNRWYALEVGLEQHEAQDRLRIWFDGAPQEAPTYQVVGDLFGPDAWGVGTEIGARRSAGVPADTTFYYDDITIADGFIGLKALEDVVAPSAPGDLRVE